MQRLNWLIFGIGSMRSIDMELLTCCSDVQAIEDARTTVNSNVDSFTSKADDIHNTTVDKITKYEADYMPTVRTYDR